MGVPTITLAGKIPSARGGVSVCRGLGLDDWIASDPQDFRDKAVAFASDWGRLSKIRGSMRERMDRELVNSAKFIADYESQLRGVWRDWCKMKAE
jgi:predicted O-linked N-acetylglucosamine transferase (SPINDLY family)